MQTYVMKMAGVCENYHVARCGGFIHENLPKCLEIGESLFIS